jgi:hypothetical protein
VLAGNNVADATVTFDMAADAAAAAAIDISLTPITLPDA